MGVIDLSPFGWSPGRYWFVCRDCRKQQCVGSKRSWRCEECAKLAADKWVEAIPPDDIEIPKPGTIWQHYNGGKYVVLLITNADHCRQEKYPTTVVYSNVVNGKNWSRPLSEWHRSMTIVTSGGDRHGA